VKPSDVQHIIDALKRGASTWQLTEPPPGAPRNVAALSVGSPSVIGMSGVEGRIIIIGMTREELYRLRDAATEFLAREKI
jgi:hypothetical protein